MQKTTIETFADITPEQIAEWKEKYEDIYKLGCDGKYCIVKSVDRKTLSYSSSIGTKDPMKFNEMLLKGCWLGGDIEIQTVDKYFISVGQKLAELLQIKEATLEKL